MEPMTDHPTTSEVFEVLTSIRRRRALHVLDDEGEVDVGHLAERLGYYEYGKTPSQLGAQERKRIYISLKQQHLPVMDEYNIVNYDDRDNVVSLTDNAGDVLWYLQNGPHAFQPKQLGTI